MKFSKRILIKTLKVPHMKTSKMAQQVRVLAHKPDDLGWIPYTSGRREKTP